MDSRRAERRIFVVGFGQAMLNTVGSADLVEAVDLAVSTASYPRGAQFAVPQNARRAILAPQPSGIRGMSDKTL
jgi:hypothetical protein